MRYEDINSKNMGEIFRYSGVGSDDFKQLVILLRRKFEEKHKKGGRNPKISIENMLLATFRYNNSTSYTYKTLAKEFLIHESNMYETIKWIEKTLKEYDLIFYSDFCPLSININKLHELILKEKTFDKI